MRFVVAERRLLIASRWAMGKDLDAVNHQRLECCPPRRLNSEHQPFLSIAAGIFPELRTLGQDARAMEGTNAHGHTCMYTGWQVMKVLVNLSMYFPRRFGRAFGSSTVVPCPGL